MSGPWAATAIDYTLANATVINGHDLDSTEGVRNVRLRSAAGITPKRARWLWHQRIPEGELTLLAGREGIGKSTVAYALAADVTRGTLRGQPRQRPRNVVIAATEDSWEHTIVPRLLASGADLNRVFQVEVIDSAGHDALLTLPRDLDRLEQQLADNEVALLLLDPLMSRLDGRLDSHKDADVRRALEPVTKMAQRTRTAVVGLIHHNKAGGSDLLNAIMSSKAFAAVARAVLSAVRDPEQDGVTLLGLSKSNLGPTDLPTLTFTLSETVVGNDEDGPITATRVQWGPERTESVRDVLERTEHDGGPEQRTAVSEAAVWLTEYLTTQGGSAPSADVYKAGAAADHSRDALKRARIKAEIEAKSEGFPRRTFWNLP